MRFWSRLTLKVQEIKCKNQKLCCYGLIAAAYYLASFS